MDARTRSQPASSATGLEKMSCPSAALLFLSFPPKSSVARRQSRSRRRRLRCRCRRHRSRGRRYSPLRRAATNLCRVSGAAAIAGLMLHTALTRSHFVCLSRSEQSSSSALLPPSMLPLLTCSTLNLCAQ